MGSSALPGPPWLIYGSRGTPGTQRRLSGSSTDWPPKKSWWCFGQLVKSLSQLDMNFTTLIMLIFTAISAIGLVSKGLRACWPKLDEIWWYSFFDQNSLVPLLFLTFFHFKCSQPKLTLILSIGWSYGGSSPLPWRGWRPIREILDPPLQCELYGYIGRICLRLQVIVMTSKTNDTKLNITHLGDIVL